jgi:hypothetical protein
MDAGQHYDTVDIDSNEAPIISANHPPTEDTALRATGQSIVLVQSPYHAPQYHYGPFGTDLAPLIEPSRLNETPCAGCFPNIDVLKKLLWRCMCFWAIISIVSIPICAVMSSQTGNNDWMVVLAFLQMISVIGMLPLVVKAAWSLYAQVRVYHVVFALFLNGMVFLLESALNAIPGDGIQSVLQWNWMMYVSSDSELSGNSIAFGFKYVWSSVLFFLLLVALFPVLALVEELIFRARTTSWKSAVVRNLIFGCMHLLAGSSLGSSLLILSTLGMFLTREYFEGVRRYTLSCMIVDAAAGRTGSREACDEINAFVAKANQKNNAFLRSLGYFSGSWSISSIGKWKADALDLSWENILNTTEKRCNHDYQFGQVINQPVDNLLAIHAGFASSTVLHMTYNLVTVVIFCVQLASS